TSPFRRVRRSSAGRWRRSRKTPTSCAGAGSRSPAAGWRRSTASPTSTAAGPMPGDIWLRFRTRVSRPTSPGTDRKVCPTKHRSRISTEIGVPKMARRRNLNGLATVVLSSFLSRNNDVEGYWAFGKLYLNALQYRQRKVVIDFLSGTLSPPGEQFASMIKYYREMFFG